jgi:membrane-bound metal-dependent hydrolase YbcI (DUF457 family)
MDLFTHLLLGYLISFAAVGDNAPYLLAGAIAGGLPDADVLFWPLAKRFPILRHHGITHSIFGVTVVALAGGFVVFPYFVGGSGWLFFVVMELAGVGHMLGDAFTHFSVAPLLPFSERPLELDADRAINFVVLAVSLTGILLLGWERSRVSAELFLATVYGLMAFYVAYIGLRLIARWSAGRFRRQNPEFTHVAPSANPLKWLLLYERREGGRLRTGHAEFQLGRGLTGPIRRIDVPLTAPPDAVGPVRTREEALERSYPLARTTGSVLDQTYHFAEVVSTPDGGWGVAWYSLEFAAFGRSSAVRVRIAPDGSLSAKAGWYHPGRMPPAWA